MVGKKSSIHAEHETDRLSFFLKKAQASQARLIVKIYEIDPMVCPKCASPMKIIAVITDPDEVKKILKHLIKTGKPPPGLDPSSLNQPLNLLFYLRLALRAKSTFKIARITLN